MLQWENNTLLYSSSEMFGLLENCYGWLKTRREPVRKLKLITIGLDDAGKTTTLASLQGEPPDGITPTLGFANAELTMSRYQITIYDLGGGERVRSIWKSYYAEVYGVVFVIDSCDRNRLDDVRQVLAEVMSHQYITGKPLLLLANKQDRADALTMDMIKSEIQLDELSEKNSFSYHMVACSAVKGYGKAIDKSIEQGMRWLLSVIRRDMTNLSPRVTKEAAIQKAEDDKERDLKRAEAKRLREEREKQEQEDGVNEEDVEEDDDDVVTAPNPFMPIKDHIKSVEKKQIKTTTPAKSSKKKAKRTKQLVLKDGIPVISVVPASPDPNHEQEDSGVEDRGTACVSSDDVVAVTIHRKGDTGETAFMGNGDAARDHEGSEGDEILPMLQRRRLKKQQEIDNDMDNDTTLEESMKPKMRKKRKKIRRGNKTAPLQTTSDGEGSLHDLSKARSLSARSLPPLRGGGAYVQKRDDLPGLERLPFQIGVGKTNYAIVDSTSTQ